MGCGSSQSVAVVEANTLSKEKKILEKNVSKKIEIKEASKRVEVSSAIEEVIESSDKKNFTPRDHLKLPPLAPAVTANKYDNTTRFDSGVSNKTESTNAQESNDNASERSRRSSISSSDSGYLDNEYRHVITEKSDQNLVQQIEKQFVERNLDLLIVGKSCPPLLSAKEKEKIQIKEEKQSLEMLKKNGLVQMPITVKENSAQFEIVEEKLFSKNMSLQSLDTENNSSGTIRAPPSRLLQREKTKPSLTIDQIGEKLEKANQRKLQQIQTKIQTATVSVEKKSVSFNHKIDSRQINGMEMNDEILERQKKLRELRDKLQAKNTKESELTPRSKEVATELESFKTKTPSAFKADFF